MTDVKNPKPETKIEWSATSGKYEIDAKRMWYQCTASNEIVFIFTDIKVWDKERYSAAVIADDTFSVKITIYPKREMDVRFITPSAGSRGFEYGVITKVMDAMKRYVEGIDTRNLIDFENSGEYKITARAKTRPNMRENSFETSFTDFTAKRDDGNEGLRPCDGTIDDLVIGIDYMKPFKGLDDKCIFISGAHCRYDILLACIEVCRKKIEKGLT